MGWGPQSNQRGIETELENARAMQDRARLNRTSVGLKHTYRKEARCPLGRLNRTSVGLKPSLAGLEAARWEKASIEPAWD